MTTYTYPGGNLVIKDGMTALVEKMRKQPAKIAPIVAKYAFKVQAEAMAAAPVDTGALKNSIEAVPTSDPLTWVVQDGVFYGIFLELGTARGVSARHFLGGAVERNSDPFIAEVSAALADVE